MAYGDGQTLDAGSLAAAKSWLAEAPRTAADVEAAGKNFGLSASQIGQVFGASGSDISKTGYGASSGLDKSLSNYTYSSPSNSWSAGASATAPAPSPAPASGSGYNGGAALTQSEIDYARKEAGGKTGQWAAYQAARLGLNADQFGQAFGWQGDQVKEQTGYGTEGGFKDDPYGAWEYESATNAWGPKKTTKPSTGINLSQLQGPTAWNVGANETVRSQLQQIIADDSPLMQQARARALQTANSRGLLNSSMAMTAADSAMYDAVMPIATQDASTYARAGEFNANANNTFARDNNQFTRDAFMADFNVGANDWAAQQNFEREYKMLDRQQQLTLERDAVQNGYTSARDQFNAQVQLQRDATDAQLRRELASLDAASRASSIQPDTSLERLRMQLEADANRTQSQFDMQKQSDTIANLNALRSEYADKVFRINTSELSPEKADKAVMDLAATYNPMITSAATKLGYDPASWMIKISTPQTEAPTPAPAPVAPEQLIGAGE